MACVWSAAFTSGRHTLAATWRHRGWCWRWWCRLYLDTKHWEQFPVFLQIPPATLNLVFSSLASELSWEEREGGEGKLSSRAAGHSEIDGAESSSSKSRLAGNTCLKSAQFCVSIRLLFLFVCVTFCLNNHIVTMLRVQWKDFLRRYWIITNSDQPLADCLSDISLFGYKCWLDPGQAHCHWGPGLSALSWSPDPLESVLFWDRGEVFSPVRLGSGGIRPSFIRFFCFILRFWNQIFTWKATRVSKSILWTNFMLTCFSVTVSGVFLEISTWVSFSWSAAAISIRLARVRYLLKWNSFSSSVNCLVEKFVRPVLLMPPPPPWPP